ncbi:MAG: hypothetical protein PVF96_05335 [Candidatus Bathyarchaeota archaeon]|jgi:hypothetical protein
MKETTNITDTILQTLHTPNKSILKRVPNLNPEDYSLLLYLIIGYDLGKGKYFGLTFPLEDSTHMAELRALSNGYVEFRDGVVRMGVVKLENLEKILRVSYIKPKSIHIL